jgi:gamma-glutamyltranspeptidase/glutathione hydrolase
VSATPSGGWLSSSPVVPDLGFPISTRAQMFSFARVALVFGARTATPHHALADDRWSRWRTVDGAGNTWRRPARPMVCDRTAAPLSSSLQPSGRDRLGHVPYPPRSGLILPKVARPGALLIESRFPDATLKSLRDRGHRLTIDGAWSLGRVCAAKIEHGMLKAAATPRFMQSYAIGR